MSQAVGPLVDRVLQRAFDPAGVGTTRAQVRDLLSRLQQCVNAAFDSTIATVPFTVQPYLQVYKFVDVQPDIIKIKGVRDGSRDLSRIEFSRLKQIDNHWFGRTGRRLETYAVVGQLLILHPAQPSASSVNVVYVQQLPALNVDADTVNLPDDQIPILVRLAEAMVLLKQRDLGPLQAILAEYMPKNEAAA